MPFSTCIVFTAILLGLGAGLCEATECDCNTPSPTAKTTTSPTPAPITQSPPTPAPVVQVVSNGSQTRTIAIKSLCSFDIGIGFTGGFAGSAPCEGNQTEDLDSARCFWSLAELPDFLEAGQDTLVEIEKTSSDAENDVVVSGAIYAIQSPYMDDACRGGCSASRGVAGTVTLTEFTMLANPTLTYYDVSHVHGANIPVTFGPSVSTKSHTDDPYRNGVAGGECSWAFEPPEEYRIYLIEVKNARETCSQDDECDVDQGEVCGASFEGDAPVYGTCGELFGYLNAHNNCIAGSQGYPFYCEVFHDLYGCSGQYNESGYSESVTSAENVCGCNDYSGIGIPASFPCINSNPLWVDKAYPWIEYLKKACPTAYEYAYSDSTSTFVSDYDTFELVFCPDDSEGRFYT